MIPTPSKEGKEGPGKMVMFSPYRAGKRYAAFVAFQSALEAGKNVLHLTPDVAALPIASFKKLSRKAEMRGKMAAALKGLLPYVDEDIVLCITPGYRDAILAAKAVAAEFDREG